ncbi:hypothetical protein CK203_059051 [Vitis vinifera]|uniref:Uncharacterized protein n=1 Tax=Vitis vinifera TaxID=29760 RepID=A0A438GCT4_VITVI|nr:hypothetical protein CK203_059051 [Vitis vinifera]
MRKRKLCESIPMSIYENMVDSQSLIKLESLVSAYVFNISLSISELLIDFDREH